jgi:hypothetical protein
LWLSSDSILNGCRSLARICRGRLGSPSSLVAFRHDKETTPDAHSGPLHFEDLEPHRFEDLVRRLIYDFRPWRQLEATGRSGAAMTHLKYFLQSHAHAHPPINERMNNKAVMLNL